MKNVHLSSAPRWYLEGFIGESSSVRRIVINSWPFRIGRRADLSFCLPSNSVSKEHAEIWHDGASLRVRDLASRNGTFVNGARIDREVPLKPGDVLHFADHEFHVGFESGASAGATMQLDRNEWVASLRQFEKLFEEGAAMPFFQPIVKLPQPDIFGYEVLARSRLAGLESPKQMFAVAARLSVEGRLSRLFRREGVHLGQDLPGLPNLFLNTHPVELAETALVESLRDLRESAPDQPLTLEIHEGAVTDPEAMRELHCALRDLNIQLAYDDFGAGQARLTDLIEVPPDYLKFDICLVRDIHTGSDQRRQMLETLVRMAHDLGVAVLAEGIECEAEGEVCAQIGFDYAQGFYYGKPAAVVQMAEA
ncbi:MAG: EAL domain-containing protein [Planctomycetia bacterium]|nr:EAL domain-containing protein [Planctomycetia bacterium]